MKGHIVIFLYTTYHIHIPLTSKWFSLLNYLFLRKRLTITTIFQKTIILHRILQKGRNILLITQLS